MVSVSLTVLGKVQALRQNQQMRTGRRDQSLQSGTALASTTRLPWRWGRVHPSSSGSRSAGSGGAVNGAGPHGRLPRALQAIAEIKGLAKLLQASPATLHDTGMIALQQSIVLTVLFDFGMHEAECEACGTSARHEGSAPEEQSMLRDARLAVESLIASAEMQQRAAVEGSRLCKALASEVEAALLAPPAADAAELAHGAGLPGTLASEAHSTGGLETLDMIAHAIEEMGSSRVGTVDAGSVGAAPRDTDVLDRENFAAVDQDVLGAVDEDVLGADEDVQDGANALWSDRSGSAREVESGDDL